MKALLVIIGLLTSSFCFSQSYYVERVESKEEVTQHTPKDSEVFLLEDRIGIWIKDKCSTWIQIETIGVHETRQFKRIVFGSKNGEIVYIRFKKDRYSVLRGNLLKTGTITLTLQSTTDGY